MPYSPANKEAMMYDYFMNKRYKEPEDGKFEDATKDEAVFGHSNTDYNEEMESVAAIPAHLADNFNDIHVFFEW